MFDHKYYNLNEKKFKSHIDDVSVIPPLVRCFGAAIYIASDRSVRKDLMDEIIVPLYEIISPPEIEVNSSISLETSPLSPSLKYN